MAKTSGLGDRFLVDGHDLSGDVGAIDEISGGPAPVDVTRLSQSAVARTGGLFDASIGWTSYFNPSAAAAHPVLSTLPIGDRVTTYLRGATLGAPGAGLVAKQIGYGPERGDDGSLTLSVVAHASAGLPLEWGVQGTAGVRTDTTATNGASVDGGIPSARLAAYLHVAAVSGTSVTVKVQSSSDDGGSDAWADVLTFTAVTAAAAPTAARVEVTGTVERYLRVVTTGTFSSAQFAVLLCRYRVLDPYTATYTSTY